MGLPKVGFKPFPPLGAARALSFLHIVGLALGGARGKTVSQSLLPVPMWAFSYWPNSTESRGHQPVFSCFFAEEVVPCVPVVDLVWGGELRILLPRHPEPQPPSAY